MCKSHRGRGVYFILASQLKILSGYVKFLTIHIPCIIYSFFLYYYKWSCWFVCHALRSIGFLHMDFLDAIQDKGSKINQVFVNIFLSIFISYRAEQCLSVSLMIKILVTANQFVSNLQRILLLALQRFKKNTPLKGN